MFTPGARINTTVTSTSHAQTHTHTHSHTHTHTHTYTHTHTHSYTHTNSLASVVAGLFDDKHYQNKCRNKPSLLLTVAATVAVSYDVSSGMMVELR